MNSSYDDLVGRVRSGELTAEAAAHELLDQLTRKEMLGLLDGDVSVTKMASLPTMIKTGPISAGQVPRVGYPGVWFSDGPRGVVSGRATAFPVTMARAATWDPELEEKVGLAIGRESRAQGANYSGAVCINLVRHPAWGRAQETYGDDPVLLGRMGAALTTGLRRNVMACVKHFALNSMENARFKVDVIVDEHALHEVYLPHFKATVDAGADSIMSAYNSVNGAFAGENRALLTEILRDEWGFDGFVTSDWVWGTHDGVESLQAGMDIEMPARMHRKRQLPKALRSGRVSRDLVRLTAHRIVSTVIRHAAQRDLTEPGSSVLASSEHRALAREVAAKAMVLLKNDPTRSGDPLLPLDAATTRIAVIGRLATEPNMGDKGSSLVDPPSSSSPLDGLREALPHATIIHDDGSDPARAAILARDADVAIVVAGMGATDEGERVVNEDSDLSILGFPFTLKPVQWLAMKMAPSTGQFGRGGDRESLTLSDTEEQLIHAVAAAQQRTAVVLIGGSAIITENWRHDVPAILMSWYPGMEGGRALADVLTGATEPGGRLPLAFPASAAHLPFFDADATSIVYDEWWGQRKLDRDGNAAAFPLGFGLGYTTFDVALAGDSDALRETASVRVANTGARSGSTVVQVYAIDRRAARPVPQLIGFRRVELPAGGTSTIEVRLDLTPTRTRDPHTRIWSPRAGDWAIVAGQHSPVTAHESASSAADSARARR